MEKLKRILNRERGTLKESYLQTIFVWNPLLSVVICIWLNGFNGFFNNLVGSYLITAIVSSVCYIVVMIADQVFTKSNKSTEWHYSISLCAMPLGVFLAFKLVGWAAPFIGLRFSPPNIDDYRISLLIGTLIGILFFFIRARTEAKEAAKSAALKLKEMENERLQAQIAALTAQMNPHLLFNALNTVASLIQTNPEEAEKTIVKLSELYRGVLSSSRKMLHPLKMEIELCEAYLGIEKARFGERLRIKVEIHPDVDMVRAEIPALSIQPLVENAIKHGLAPRSYHSARFK